MIWIKLSIDLDQASIDLDQASIDLVPDLWKNDAKSWKLDPDLYEA